MSYSVILVDSTSHAIRIEKLLTQHQIICKLVPVPRHLSSDCGVCVRFVSEAKKTVEALIAAQSIQIQSIEDL